MGMRSMNVCGWTSVLVPAFFAGFAIASMFGSDLAGWVAALVVGLAVAAYQARSGETASCALPRPADEANQPTRANEQSAAGG